MSGSPDCSGSYDRGHIRGLGRPHPFGAAGRYLGLGAAVEIIFEFVFQVLFEIIAQALFEIGLRGTARVLRSRIGRFFLASAFGYGGGLFWGARLSERGRVEEPRTLWISLGLAIAVGLAALWRWRATNPKDEPPAFSPPWRWPAHRLAGFAVLNAAIAAGVAIGFNPRPLR